MTRWHVDDLLGRLEERWPDLKVLRYPAIAEEDTAFRPRGDPLFPELKSRGFLLGQKKLMSEASWQSLYQQNPIVVGGGIFPIGKLQVIPIFDRSKIRTSVRAWDKSATHGGGDYTAGVLMHAMVDGTYVIEDVVRGQWSALDREQQIKATAAADEHRSKAWYEIVIEQEPGSGGKELFEATARKLAGYCVYADKVTGSKKVRAEPFAAQVQGGNVWLVSGKYVQGFLDEMEVFPTGTHDDQVDAAAMAFARLTSGLQYNLDGHGSCIAWDNNASSWRYSNYPILHFPLPDKSTGSPVRSHGRCIPHIAVRTLDRHASRMFQFVLQAVPWGSFQHSISLYFPSTLEGNGGPYWRLTM